MADTTALHRSERPEILWEYTRSLCPTCLQVIYAQFFLRDNKVYLHKRCSQEMFWQAFTRSPSLGDENNSPHWYKDKLGMLTPWQSAPGPGLSYNWEG